MNRIMLNILSLTLLLSFSNCKKEPPPPPISNGNLSPVVWSYDVERSDAFSSANYIYNNHLIQCIDSKYGKTVVYCMTLDSGKIIWQNDQVPFRAPLNPEDVTIKGNLFIMEGKGKLFSINLDNGKTAWTYSDPLSESGIGVSISGDYLYYTISSCRLLQFDLKTGTSKTILTLNSEDLDNYRPRLTAPTFWKHPNGDEILIMGNRSYNGQVSNFDRYDMLAYNLTADTMLWYNKGVLGIRGSISTPLILDDKVVFYLSRNVECINPLNGEPIWTHTRHPSDNFSAYKSGNITSWNNILIAKPDSDHMYGIDINTGQEIWVNPSTASMPFTIRVSMNKIWYSSGGVNCIDAITGNSLIDKWRYQNKGSWINPIAVDENTGYIYTTAHGVIYCLDANMLMEK